MVYQFVAELCRFSAVPNSNRLEWPVKIRQACEYFGTHYALSRQRLYDGVGRMILTLKSRASEHMEDSHQQIASKVRAFIQGHLAEGISLQTVADHVGLHPARVSRPVSLKLANTTTQKTSITLGKE